MKIEFYLHDFLIFFPQEIQDKVISPEKAEEAKLKARYPNLGNKPGGSDLLRKRLQKGVSNKEKCSFTWCSIGLMKSITTENILVFSHVLISTLFPAKVF